MPNTALVTCNIERSRMTSFLLSWRLQFSRDTDEILIKYVPKNLFNHISSMFLKSIVLGDLKFLLITCISIDIYSYIDK